MPTNEEHRAACEAAHHALWTGLKPSSHEDVKHFLSRLSKLITSDILNLTGGNGENAAKLLNECLVPIVEAEIAFLVNDPEVKKALALMELMAMLRGDR